jgi:hypothetical protein
LIITVTNADDDILKYYYRHRTVVGRTRVVPTTNVPTLLMLHSAHLSSSGRARFICTAGNRVYPLPLFDTVIVIIIIIIIISAP